MNGAPRRNGRTPAQRSTAPFGLRPSGAVERCPQTGQFICSKTGHFYLLPTVLGTNRLSALVTNELSGFAVGFFGWRVAWDETDLLVTGDKADAI